MRNTLMFVAIAAIITTIIGLIAADSFDLIGNDSAGTIASLVAMTCLAVLIGSRAMGNYQGKGGTMLWHAAIWLGIGLVAALLYRWREPLGLG
ncbi:hypothetical protein [Terrihabitans sp. B22-R8]|uniref:hypothetical protein n=1 Tax=Terrihabitans sp. B22-R8 TaxID=3425128 RepID=UPI00403C12C6